MEEVWTWLSCEPGHPPGLTWSLTVGTQGTDSADSGFNVAPQSLSGNQLCVTEFANQWAWLTATLPTLFRTTKC